MEESVLCLYKKEQVLLENIQKKEPLEIVGFITCGGCPGERLERAPSEMKKYGAEEIYLASCFLAGYPPCPYIGDFIQYIENYVKLPVVVGTHPMPTNYINAHLKAKDWDRNGTQKYLEKLTDDPEASLRYDSTRPDFLKIKKTDCQCGYPGNILASCMRRLEFFVATSFVTS